MATVAPAAATPWHAVPADEAARELDVTPAEGLSSAEGERRLARHGRNASRYSRRCAIPGL